MEKFNTSQITTDVELLTMSRGNEAEGYCSVSEPKPPTKMVSVSHQWTPFYRFHPMLVREGFGKDAHKCLLHALCRIASGNKCSLQPTKLTVILCDGPQLWPTVFHWRTSRKMVLACKLSMTWQSQLMVDALWPSIRELRHTFYRPYHRCQNTHPQLWFPPLFQSAGGYETASIVWYPNSAKNPENGCSWCITQSNISSNTST